MHRRTLIALATVAPIALAAGTALAWPDQAVNYIIPFNPGGESDVTARFQQPFFEEKTGQQLIVQYQAGAGGAQAWSQLNTMPADGSTIMGTNLPHIILQPLTGDVGYQTDDLTTVYWFHYTPDAILVPAESEFQTLQDLIDYAQANPGLVTFAGSATNSANHLAQQKFNKLAGVVTTYIPFSGTAPAMTAVLGNQVTASMGYTTYAAQQPDALRMLAVATDERLEAFPDVPTFKELGLDMVGGAYRGVAVPKDTPEETRQAISDAVDQINQDPAFIKQMSDAGFVVTNIPYAEVAAFMDTQKAEIGAVAEEMGIVKQ